MASKSARLSALLLPLLIVTHIAAAQSLAPRARPGVRLPLDAIVIDETGRAMRLGVLLGGRPTLLLPGYFHCRKLCSPLRHAVMEALGESGLLAGVDYELLALSVDEFETTEDSVKAKAESLALFPFPGTDTGWRFLRAARVDNRMITDAIGLDYKRDQGQNIIHPIEVVVLTPDGVISRYLPGFGLDASIVRMAVTKAASGEIAAPAAPLSLLCFNVDPVTGEASFSFIKALGLLTLGSTVVGALLIGRAILRERRT